MSTLVVVLMAALAAAPKTGTSSKGTKSTIPSLPMPPPPAPPPPPPVEAAPRPPPPAPPAPKVEQPRELRERMQVSGALGPTFGLNNAVANQGGLASAGSPVWMRVVLRGTLDLLKLGPGDLQFLVPLGLQGTGFNTSGIQGSVFGWDVMPSIRYVADIIPGVGLFGEFGMGLGFYQFTIQWPFYGYLGFGMGGFGVRLGAGVQLSLFDKLRLIVQPMETEIITMSGSITSPGQTTPTPVTGTASTWSLIFGAVYSL